MGIVKNAVTALSAKSPTEAEGYKTWLASVAAKVSQASSVCTRRSRPGPEGAGVADTAGCYYAHDGP